MTDLRESDIYESESRILKRIESLCFQPKSFTEIMEEIYALLMQEFNSVVNTMEMADVFQFLIHLNLHDVTRTHEMKQQHCHEALRLQTQLYFEFLLKWFPEYSLKTLVKESLKITLDSRKKINKDFPIKTQTEGVKRLDKKGCALSLRV